jgi:hypothetical protein
MANHNQHSSDILPPPKHELKPFTYAPLDHQKASLRLIRVLEAKSSEGYIQCEIRHATIEDSYICLSYVWGDELAGHTIILGNQHFRIRNNLYSFLVTTTQKRRLLENWLWIDALSIDQTNVEERNHQVQQMGLIFSRAREVLAWLGDNAEIAAYLYKVEEAFIQGPGFHSNQLAPPFRGTTEYRQQLAFHQSEYWKRAWITQEVALARQITVCASLAEMTFELFPATYYDGLPPDDNLKCAEGIKFKGRSLIDLINWFEAKESHERRDCIYSLLALCGEGSDLHVDYNDSEMALAKRTLACCKQSFCLCSIKVVAYALDIGEHRPWHWVDQTLDLSSEPFAYMTLPIVRGILPSWVHREVSEDYHTSDFHQCIQHAGFACAQLSHEEDTAVFLDPSGDVLIVIFPEQICPSSGAALLEIRMKMGDSHSTLVACDLNGQKARRRLVNGLIVVLSGETCQVLFSFQLLLVLNQAIYTHRPCDRVGFQGTGRAKYLSEPLLRLYS